MTMVNMHEAKSRLSALVAAIESGSETEIVIARNGAPAARIMPIGKPDVSKRIGIAKGKFTIPDDWDKHDEEIAALFNEGEWYPGEPR